MNILEEIIAHKRQLLEKQKKEISQIQLLRSLDRELPFPRFQSTISEGTTHLIAELKKASPSAGIIREDFDLIKIAKAYAQAGASCLSVLTEDKFFLGDITFLDRLRPSVSLPLLRKDFVIDAYQIYEAKAHGADAVLLIASLLKDSQVRDFLEVARSIKLDVVLEVHDETELRRACGSGAKMIGINARNLLDFSVDLNTLTGLLSKVPADRFVVCESGIKTIDDLGFIRDFRVNAVLIGEALLRAGDIGSKAKEFADFLKKQ